MEAIIVVVGFLGAGKTTLLKQLIHKASHNGWQPFVVLNDYENAQLDAEQLTSTGQAEWIKALSGSCICCSGVAQLRETVNRIPERKKGITLIEANGTTDACSLMGFLAVGIDDRFLPPIQISVVDVQNWQQRGEHNELEANQIQVSTLIVLTHLDKISGSRKQVVMSELKKLNPSATILEADEIDLLALVGITPSNNVAPTLDHQKSHCSSYSSPLPELPDAKCIDDICRALPKSILRVKGFAKIIDRTASDADGNNTYSQNNSHYTYFERTPAGAIHTRPYNGTPTMGATLLIVGPGSNQSIIDKVLKESLAAAALRHSLQ